MIIDRCRPEQGANISKPTALHDQREYPRGRTKGMVHPTLYPTLHIFVPVLGHAEPPVYSRIHGTPSVYGLLTGWDRVDAQ